METQGIDHCMLNESQVLEAYCNKIPLSTGALRSMKRLGHRRPYRPCNLMLTLHGMSNFQAWLLQDNSRGTWEPL